MLGPTLKEGHETDFSNLRELGWVSNVTDYLAAADIVVASAGDNTVTEIARVGRPLVIAPEWRYFNEQTRKAEAMAAVGAAVHAQRWPGDLAGWQGLMEEARQPDRRIVGRGPAAAGGHRLGRRKPRPASASCPS